MDKVSLAIVGCGGMGGRHLLGLKELADSGISNVELVAACDLRQDNAEHLADDAERLLGRRPAVFADMAQMVAALPELQAVDITTEGGSHHRVAIAAFELGLHVLVEKPMGITVRACNLILAAQQRAGKLLSVAENYRRDPMSRLTRALLDARVIGTPWLFMDIGSGSGDRIIITPWRHLKHMGGMLLDGGVHNADLMLYYMGDVREVYAQTRLWEKTRYRPDDIGGLTGFYERWAAEMPASIQATAEDTLVSVLNFCSGALGQWTQSYAGHGQGSGLRVLYGSKGSLVPGGSRNGVPPVLHLDGVGEVKGPALLELAPRYTLDEISSRLYATDGAPALRPGSYQLPFPNADRKLLAIECFEFADCILKGTTPEVDGRVGRRAVAICYAAFEAGVLNRAVTLAEIEAETTGSYEADVNAYYRL